MHKPELKQKAVDVLKYNDVGKWTRPSPEAYPHQWLWDSAFTAIGQRHYSVRRAQQEILSIFRGQWTNGMVPNMIFGETKKYHSFSNLWNSKVSPYAPEHLETTGITQPPMLAEAVVKIGEMLTKRDRKIWYRKVFPYLLDYHNWLYRDRNPHAEGLVILIHPWETGLDNTPPWMRTMREHHLPLWIKIIEWTRLDKIIERLRRDTRQVPVNERMTTLEGMMLFQIVRRLRRKQYDTERILSRSHFIIEDLFFNCVLIRANQHLKTIAQDIGETIPEHTLSFMHKAEKSLEDLWEEELSQYYSRNFVSRSLIIEPSIATLMPLYAGCITKKRAKQLVDLMKDEQMFKANYPVPSVPFSSRFFDPRRYWQGPSWVNTNWLIIDGLERYGFKEEAKQLRKSSIDMVEKSGFFEYFSPYDGYGAGIAPFSWTAALTIDLLEQAK